MNRTISWIAAACLCAALGVAACARDYGVTINAIPGLPQDFVKGADVSMLAQFEASGAKFYDEDGRQKDALRILREHGVNWVRLRLWNAPVLAHDFSPEAGVTARAGEAAGGANDLARDIALARRARALGMKVLLDFHYSDWWADPGKQFVPQAWEGMDLGQLETALHAFTADALRRMRAAGAGPDMVQLGNEVTNGMLWPQGWIDNRDPATWDGFVALLGAGARAVREVDGRLPIVVHLDRGGDNALYRRFFSALDARGVDYDVIGLSYYPAWHGTLSALRDNLTDISQTFGRPVVIAETAYPWTTDDADGQGNSWSGSSALTSGPYLPTVQGQATFLRDLMAIVAGVPRGRGLGVFYWEPDWIAVQGAGWYTRGGDGWDNQAMFDHEGKALASLNVFRAVSEPRPPVVARPASVPPQPPVFTLTGTPAALPSTAAVFYDDASLRSLEVVWDPIDPAVWDAPGTFALHGTLPAAPDLSVTLSVTISGLVNPGFEDGADHAVPGWTVTADPTPSDLGGYASDVRTGARAFHWWNGTAFEFRVEQTVAGLRADRTYALSLRAMGAAGQSLTAYAYCPPDAAAPAASASFELGGWTSDPAAWLEPTVTGLPGAAGACRVGVASEARAGDWGSLDDFGLAAE